MKLISTAIILLLGTYTVFAQKGSLNIQQMLALSSASVSSAADQLVKEYGFEIRKEDIPAGNSSVPSDSSIYFIWFNENGDSNNRIFFNSKINNGVFANLISYTSMDSSWYAGILQSLKAKEFTLTDIKILSDDAHDAQVYETGNYRISVFWSYMGGEIKYYIVDVNWFSE